MFLLVAKIYGIEGHRQKESFNNSKFYDFSKESNAKIIVVLNSDITGTNDYSEIFIIRNSEEECFDTLWGQISDGIYENYRVGQVDVIKCIEV